MNANSHLNLTAEEPAPQSSIRERASASGRSPIGWYAVDTFVPEAAVAEAADVEALVAGTVLGGKYRIERKIGEGAMGVVLAATHLGLDEAVAIKFMRPEVQSVPGTIARFAKEAKIAARIRSEHVTKVLDVGVMPALGPFIVMEYLEGQSLADLLEARLDGGRGPLSAERVVEYVLQACEALAAAHAIGVIHRDVKPDNLFVTRHGGLETLKLLDFGISKAALTGSLFGDEVATNTLSFVMGTPLYMSPEQLRSSPDVDCRTDIWSMGAVMYELMTGLPPFNGQSIPEICAAILDAPPAELPASVSTELRAIVMRCLEKDPARRYQSIADLAAALVPLAPGEARAYASRSSCILRASALNLKIGPEVLARHIEPPRPTSRLQSSALVAATTVLALSALGVAITFAKLHGRTEPFPIQAPATSIPLTVLPTAHEPGLPSLRVFPVAESSDPTPGLAEAVMAPQASKPKRSRSSTKAAIRSTRVVEDAVLAEAGSDGTTSLPDAPRAGRVRLVEPPDRSRPANRPLSAASRARGER